MTVQSSFSQIRGVPFYQLFISPLNVRKSRPRESIPSLANSIKFNGVAQNLVGHEAERTPGKRFTPIGVVAGGRRYEALHLLLKEGVISKNFIVPCLVTSREAAVALSLAENSDRESLHPADEFEAARALVEAGSTIEEVAARLHMQPLLVQRRLKLANVAPEFIRMYRKGAISLEHLMAFAITDDQERQRHVWKGLPERDRTDYAIRCALTETEISAQSPVARFVTVKAYEKAGGQCRRDLFSDDQEVFLLDLELLQTLALQKLEKKKAELQEQGQVWVDVSARVDFADRAGYGRVRTSRREPNKKERVRLNALDKQATMLEADRERLNPIEGDVDPETVEALETRAEKLASERDAFLVTLEAPIAEQQAKSGALVCIDRSGRLKVETGLLRAEDAKLFAAQARNEAKAEDADATREHSAALLSRVTAHRTMALRAAFAQDPEVALAAVVHRFVIDTFDGLEFCSASALQIRVPQVRLSQLADDLENTPASAWLESQRKHLKAILPAEPQAWFEWILAQSYVEKLALLAFCASFSLDAVQNHERESVADPLARALRIDLRQWWTPTALGYFNRIAKASILLAVTEGASAQAAATMERLKKKALAEAAEKALSGKGWLPRFLRESWMPTERTASSG